jgi:2-polyprenyl-3-methyl-5-hydroxy-6-metoxy-1,4-benzoquinol methylase
MNGNREVDRSYYRNERRPLSVHISQANNVILDVGCGAGHFGAYLKQCGKAAKVIGIELFADAAEEARSKLDAVICANLDDYNLAAMKADLGYDKFDVITCADVLEHVRDPWKTLRELGQHLNEDGKVIVSVPNVRHWSVLLPLLFKGRWDYRDAGIMDRTHLRFFTKATAVELLRNADLAPSSVNPLLGARWRTLSRWTLGLLEEFLAVQYVIVAHPLHSGRTGVIPCGPTA